jgi:hypothetical protein
LEKAAAGLLVIDDLEGVEQDRRGEAVLGLMRMQRENALKFPVICLATQLSGWEAFMEAAVTTSLSLPLHRASSFWEEHFAQKADAFFAGTGGNITFLEALPRSDEPPRTQIWDLIELFGQGRAFDGYVANLKKISSDPSVRRVMEAAGKRGQRFPANEPGCEALLIAGWLHPVEVQLEHPLGELCMSTVAQRLVQHAIRRPGNEFQ